MTLEEVFTIGVIAVLATAATGAIYLGLLNWIGAFYVVRCAACTISRSRRRTDPRNPARTAGTRF